MVSVMEIVMEKAGGGKCDGEYDGECDGERDGEGWWW